MKIGFAPQGVCCQQMNVEISDDNKLVSAEFYGGCNGNLQGIAKLIQGMDISEVIERLEGISCGGKGTSCPDQLAKGLKQYLKMLQDGSFEKANQ